MSTLPRVVITCGITPGPAKRIGRDIDVVANQERLMRRDGRQKPIAESRRGASRRGRER